jgi:hypothetical protein
LRIQSPRMLAAALVILLAGCAAQSPAHTAASTDSPSPSAGTSTHVLSYPSDGAIGITVAVPDSDWSGLPGEWIMEWLPSDFDQSAGAHIIAFVVDKEFYVYGDPCDWQSTRPEVPATTVDEIVAALANQASRNPSAPEEITVGGHPGKKIILHVPDDVRFKDCDGGIFSTLGVGVDRQAHLWAQGSGEIDEIWIVDVNGRIALLEGGYYAKTPAHAVDELHSILSSATFD